MMEVVNPKKASFMYKTMTFIAAPGIVIAMSVGEATYDSRIAATLDILFRSVGTTAPLNRGGIVRKWFKQATIEGLLGYRLHETENGWLEVIA